MDDPRWLRLITIGLVLAALATGYFLLTGKLASNSSKTASQTNKTAPSPSSSISPLPSTTTQYTPSPLPASNPMTTSPAPTTLPSSTAYTRVVTRNQGEVQTLPGTGFPASLAAVLSISVIISGWKLRRFPH